MAIYEYKGFNKQGKSVKGQVDSDSQRNARLKLKKDGIFVSEIKDKSKTKTGTTKKNTGNNAKVSVQDLSQTTRQLATLVRANIPLVESLGAVSEQTENQVLKEAFADLRNMVNEGNTLHKGLLKYPRVFTNIYVTMVQAGELSGTLDLILIRLAEFLEAQHELSSRVRSAMIYPAVMITFTLLILVALFIFLVPTMREIFEGEGQKLPALSQAVFDTSDFIIQYYIPILIGLGLIVFLFLSWKKSPAGSFAWDGMVLTFPIIGRLARLIAVSRFTRTLSTLLTGGVPMLDALGIVRNVVNNQVLAIAIDNATNNIREGESIAGPLKKSGQFPPIVIHMINVGEKTGELEVMLNQVSESYDFQVKNDIDGITSLLEPILLVMMGGVIAIIIFAILMPMFEMLNFTG
jgi:general secretion pathway protein F